MDRLISIISGVFLFVVIGFIWGWLAPAYKIFPYSLINSTVNEISAFMKGGEGDKQLTIVEKLENDAGRIPFRQLVKSGPEGMKFDGCRKLYGGFSIDKHTCELFVSKNKVASGFKPAFLVYGPYIDLKAGDYDIKFDLDINASESEEAGFIDAVSVIDGSETSFYKSPLMGTGGKKHSVKYNIVLPRNVHKIEFRIFLQKPVLSRVHSLTVTKRPEWHDKKFIPVHFEHKNARRADPEIYKQQDTLFDDGLLFIFGAIDSEESLHGGIFLNKFGQIVHTVSITDDHILKKIAEFNKKHEKQYKYYPMETRFPHGVAVLHNGDIIFNDGDCGNSIRRIDWCGKEIWSRLARSHHSVTIDGKLAWHLEEPNRIVATDILAGKIERDIKLGDIIYNNRKLGGLEIRRDIMSDKYFNDPFHMNDAEPLPATFSNNFLQFATGDLLVSFRSLDMIAVLDPDTLKIKWWRVGITKRQHDPDWQPDGKITIFDNQMGNGASRIVSIDPQTFESEVIYSGAAHDAYTWMRGKHQVLSDGSILMTFSQQGRVMLVNSDGTVRFDFRNKFNDEYNLLVSEAIYLPPDFFDSDLRKCDD